jgi:hexosaminidase
MPRSRRTVLGAQANLWTEHLRTNERVQRAAFPRAAALAEVTWTPLARRDWNGFLERLAPMLERYPRRRFRRCRQRLRGALRRGAGRQGSRGGDPDEPVRLRHDPLHPSMAVRPTPQSPAYTQALDVPFAEAAADCRHLYRRAHAGRAAPLRTH